ncbi:transposase [Peptoniphilus indolicus]|uniref:Uncharacterized protein n=1 Tax=Peptoniphilus indolicus TaxID=33030 RepID=A0A379DC97_9FIRM|nr:transposase [Peptoniphilus indolicus]SUB75499.1 Uncharacterised protein [Peptoniphilus indolicus]
MERILKAELGNHLYYEYGEKSLSFNAINDSIKKTVKSSYGNDIPRDREGSFEPQTLKNTKNIYQTLTVY